MSDWKGEEIINITGQNDMHVLFLFFAVVKSMDPFWQILQNGKFFIACMVVFVFIKVIYYI